MNQHAIRDGLLRDPRGRSESEWLDTLDFLVNSLSTATSCHLHLGTYWCTDNAGAPTASIIGRVRSRHRLPGVKSDYWEAAICYTGGSDRTYADAYLFPYLEDRPVTRNGRLAPDAELDELRHWKFSDGEFNDRGWTFPDGPGEWGWIERPGDEYQQTLAVTLARSNFGYGEPILATIRNVVVPTAHRDLLGSTGRISLIHANRNKENTNLYPWGTRPSRPTCRYAIPIQQALVQDSSILVDLTRFRIRGGWTPGNYHVALRVQNCRDKNDWTYSSDISLPFKLIVE